MDPRRFSTIAHREIAVLNPIGPTLLDEVVESLHLIPGARVVDIGCGRGELMIRVLVRYRAFGLGIDSAGDLVADAVDRATLRVGPRQVEFRCENARTSRLPAQSYDAALCLGATHALGGLAATLATLRSTVRPGGLVLVGEGYWKKTPDPEYLKVLGARADEFTDHEGNVRAAARASLTLIRSWSSSDADWDGYESAYAQGIRDYANGEPGDPDVPAMIDRIDRWERAYVQFGRATLGFGIYLFRA